MGSPWSHPYEWLLPFCGGYRTTASQIPRTRDGFCADSARWTREVVNNRNISDRGYREAPLTAGVAVLEGPGLERTQRLLTTGSAVREGLKRLLTTG